MPMETPDLQGLIADFRVRFIKVRRQVYKAYSKPLPPDEVASSLAIGHEALAEYDAILNSLEPEQREMADESCAEEVGQVRAWVQDLARRGT